MQSQILTFRHLTVEIQRNITNSSLIIGKRIHDVISHCQHLFGNAKDYKPDLTGAQNYT